MHDYSGEEETVAPDQMALLQSLATKLAALDARSKELEAQQKEVDKAASQIRENDLPQLMQSLGMKDFTLADGTKFKLREEVRASFFSKDPTKREPAFDWLKQHHHEGLIKNQVTATFNIEQEKLAEKFIEFCKDKFDSPLNLQQKKDIHPMTLKAFLSEEIREGRTPPLELFGAYVQTFVKIER
jgi:hypothetical protein